MTRKLRDPAGKATTGSPERDKKRMPMQTIAVNPSKPGSVIANKMAQLQAKYPAPYGPLEEPEEPAEPTQTDND